MRVLRALLCVDDAAPDQLVEAAMPLLADPVVWVPTHIVGVRGRSDLGLPRGGLLGAGPLSRRQQEAINAATGEHTRAILDAAEASLRRHGLAWEPPQIRVGEPGREICAVAAATGARLIVLFASSHAYAESGPHSVGRTARFVLDHASCPVLLIRGGPGELAS
jgi:nucleotide-binding universal stress UspA family protein